MKWTALIASVALLAVVVTAVVFVSSYVWIPDVVSTRERVVAEIELGTGGVVQLTQEWAGDGYLTRIRHFCGRGIVTIVGDADSAKAWGCKMAHQPELGRVMITFNKKSWEYNYTSCVLKLHNGKTSVDSNFTNQPGDGSGYFRGVTH